MIDRDGKKTSLWQATAEPYASKPDSGDRGFDVIVVGGGITGISTAYLLQKAGFRCALVEAESICYGTTGGTTAHLNTIMDTPYNEIEQKFGKQSAALVHKCASDALDLIRANIFLHEIDCDFAEQEAFLFAVEEKEEKQLESIYNATVDAGVYARFTDRIPIPVPYRKAMNVKGQASFHPVKYVHGLAFAFEQAGGCIFEHCRLLETTEKEEVEISTTMGTFHSKYLIYATHTPPGVHFLHTRLIPYRSYAMAVKLLDASYPEHLCYDMMDPYHYYRTQMINGDEYLIAGGEDHKTGDDIQTSTCFLKLEAEVNRIFRVSEIHYRWSSQFYESVDGLPYIGFMPGSDKVMVATGFGGNGMTYSSVAALLFKDILLNNPNPATELFSPSRLKLLAGFSRFVRHNAGAVKELVQKMLPTPALEVLADMAPGEARVVKFEDKKLGIYKHEDGNISAVEPSCTHMGCDVHWNDAEESWDCPCHGARYKPSGEVLNGPSTQGLNEVNIAVETEKNKSTH